MKSVLPLLAVAALAACGGSAAPPAPETPAVTLPAPWSGWDLPIGAARIDEASPTELHLLYDAGKPKEEFVRWKDHMGAAGWRVAEPIVFKGIYSTDFDRGGEHFEIVVGGRTGSVDVLLTLE